MEIDTTGIVEDYFNDSWKDYNFNTLSFNAKNKEDRKALDSLLIKDKQKYVLIPNIACYYNNKIDHLTFIKIPLSELQEFLKNN